VFNHHFPHENRYFGACTILKTWPGDPQGARGQPAKARIHSGQIQALSLSKASVSQG
jgi:hypothetical protein